MELNELDNKIYIDVNGEKKEFEVIAYLNLDDTDYIVYTNNHEYENGTVALYVNCVVENEGKVTFEEVSDDELKLVIEKLTERINEHE